LEYFKKKKYLIVVLSVSCLYGYIGLDCGVPNLNRSLLVFGTKDRIAQMSEDMVESRNKIYANITGRDESDFNKKIDNDRTLLVGQMRTYLLRSTDPDEQQTLAAIGNMSPGNLDFNPHFFGYGGAYLYIVPVFLCVFKTLGQVTISSDISYYFLNPDEIAKIFIISRLVSAIAGVGVVLLIYLIAKMLFNSSVAIIAGTIAATTSIIIANSHICKPHVLGLLFSLICIYFFIKASRGLSTKQWILFGVFGGLATGASVHYALVFLPVVFKFLRKPGLKRFNVELLLPGISAIIMFFVTNPYVLISFHEAISSVSYYSGGNGGWGYASLSSDKLFIAFQELVIEGPLVVFMFFTLIYAICLYRKGNNEEKALLEALLAMVVIHGLSLGGIRFMLLEICLFILFGTGTIIYILDQNSLFSKKLKNVVISLIIIVNVLFSFPYIYDYVSKNKGEMAGEWINKNIPVGSTIGITKDYPATWHTPPFEFENYKLISIDKLHLIGERPDFVILQKIGGKVRYANDLENVRFKQNYVELKKFGSTFLDSKLGIKVKHSFANQDVTIFKKI